MPYPHVSAPIGPRVPWLGRDEEEGEVVAFLVGGAQGDGRGGVLVGAHYQLGLRLRSLLRRIKARDEVGDDVAIRAARIPGAHASVPPVAQEVFSVVFSAMRPVVPHSSCPQDRGMDCQTRRCSLGEGRRGHAGLFAHSGYFVGCHEPLREPEPVSYPTTLPSALNVHVVRNSAPYCFHVDADGLAWLPVRSSEGYLAPGA